MNNIARFEHRPLKGDDFSNHAYSPISLADKKVGSVLNNEIHSMFSYELDELPHNATTKARWGKLTLEEYKLLDQPLRLATQLLESASSSDAISSILYGERNPSPENIIHKSFPVFEFHRHTQQPSLTRERAAKALKELGKSITFELTDRDEGPKCPEGTHGTTSPITVGYPQGITITDPPVQKGLASVTVISPRYLDMLNDLLVEGLNKQFQTLKLYFEFALTICHEVVHAVNFALASELLKSYIAQGDKLVATAPFNEPFYEKQHVAELGYFWENHVFGGACIQSVPNANYPVYVAEWPSWMFRDETEQPERALPKIRALKWLVSAFYIKNIQTQEFWDTINLQHPQDLLALRINKRTAVKCFVPEGYDNYDKTWDPDAPENTLNGHFRRVSWPYLGQSPGGRLANETHT